MEDLNKCPYNNGVGHCRLAHNKLCEYISCGIKKPQVVNYKK